MLAGVVSGAGVVLLIEGEAGIGKSALFNALAARARQLGIKVFASPEVDDRGPVQPFTLLVRTLFCATLPSTPVEREVTRLVADYRHAWATWSSPDQSDSRTQIEVLFTELLEERALAGPSLVLLRDLQVVDDASLAVVQRLAAGGVIPSMMLMASTRPVPRRPELATTVAAWTRAGAGHLEIDGLTPPDAIALGEQLAGHRAGPVLRARISAAGGNPQLIVDLIQAAQESGALVEGPDDAVELAGNVVLRHLNERLAARVAYLGEEAIALLSVAAILGTSFMASDLAAVARIPEPDCWRVLRHASAAGLVMARGGRLTFRHALVRDALYAGLTSAARRELHRKAAEALFEAGAPVVVVQEHRARAEDPGWDAA
jgi:hypothetical protein